MDYESSLQEFDRLMAARDYPGARTCIRSLEESLDAAEIDDALRLEVDRRLGKVSVPLGDFQTSAERLERALRLSLERNGAEHPTSISIRSDLGGLHVAAGEYDAARVELEQAARLAEAHYGTEHSEVGTIYHNLGALAQRTARFADAVAWFEKAIKTRETALGPDHVQVSDSLNGLGFVCGQVGELDRAATALERALAIKERALGPDHPTLAFVYQNLGAVGIFRREYAEARRNLQQALEIAERQDPNHQVVVMATANLAGVEIELGLFERAKGHAERSLRVAQRTLGERHPFVASILHNTAALYRSEGDHEAARAYAMRAWELKRERLGEENADTARARLELGQLDLEADDLEGAAEHFQGALEVFERSYEGASLDTATASVLLARVKERSGDLPGARVAFERALEEFERVFGDAHPHLADGLLGLSRVSRREGKLEEARAHALRSLEVVSVHRQRAFAVLDQRRKLRVNGVVRRHLAEMFASMEGANAADVRRVVEHWFAYKGAIAAFQGRFQQLRALGDDESVALLEAHEASLRRLAAVSLAVRPDATGTQAEFAALAQEIDEQVERLSEVTAILGMGEMTDGVSLEDLRASLTDGEAFVDYAWFDDAIYAIVVRPERDVVLTRLADADSVAKRISSLRAAITSDDGSAVGSDLDGDRAALDRLLLAPLFSPLAGANRVVIAPDGVLRFLPFEVLGSGTAGGVERWQIAYVPNARSLVQLRRGQRPSPRQPAALFGDPDFADVGVGALRSSPLPAGAADSMATWIASLRFPRLPGSRLEVERIYQRMPDATVFLGADATVANLFDLHGPRIVHLATHGFVNERDTSDIDPMLRAVLAFTGARRSVRERTDDGLVPALRLAGLDLRGTELVVLSACDTALGTLQVGEGVASLDQALLGAGARAVVSTLWKVSDAAAREFMVRFYDALAEGVPPAAALQRVKTQMASTHPVRDWAAFVVNGEGWGEATARA